MERVKDEKPTAGHFITIGGDTMDIANFSRLDFGIVRIFEGRTLCALSEKEFEGIGFRVFARESEGNASIMVKEKQKRNKEGRMIIDTAASKLFLEFTEDGTARWISNAAVWLSNPEEYIEERFVDPSKTPGISMDGYELGEKIAMEKREFKSKRVDFCLSIVMDTTGSMKRCIDDARDNIIKILDDLKQVEKEFDLPEGGIVGQVVQYKDYADVMYGDTAEFITSDFNLLKNKLASFRASGGKDGIGCSFGWCEDIQGGLIRALEQVKQAPYNTFNNLILVVGDFPNHGDNKKCEITHTLQGNCINDIWDKIFEDIRSLPKIRVLFMPINRSSIKLTMRRMRAALGETIVSSTAVTKETDFARIVTETAISEYIRFIGIS